MPTATKKAPGKKAAAAKKAAKKVAATEESSGSSREEKQAANLELGKQIKELRDEGKSWAEISEETGIGQGKAMLLHMYASVAPKDRIKGASDEELAEKIVEARNNGLSWGQIMARTGLGEAKCRKLFEEASGETALGNRIGKGGRYPTGVTPPEKPAKKAAKATKASKKSAGKAESNGSVEMPPAGTPLADFSLAQLKARLTGKVVTVNRQGGGVERVSVKNVKSVKNGELSLTDKDGKSRTILLAHVKSATK